MPSGIKNMKAIILAAGLGTRLKALTTKKPKALMPIVNRPVIARNIDYLKSYGVNHIAVNAHHHHGQILSYLDRGRPFGIEIDVRVEEELLGIGGAIKNFSDFWGNDPFIVVNGDILCDIPLNKAYKYHLDSGNLATLILHDYEAFNQVMIDASCRVVDIARQKSIGRLAFTGIHILSAEILSHIPGPGYSDIIECYRRLIQSGAPIGAYVSENHYWRDIGNPESYFAANREILYLNDKYFETGSDSLIDPSVEFKGWATVGERAVLETGVQIEDSILWNDVTVKKGRRVVNSIITSAQEINRDIVNEIL
jgi:mannose-1-phosphate guanylyltransferase